MAQFKESINVKTDTDEFNLVGRPCELSAFSFVPNERHEPKDRTYYNTDRQERYSSSTYDRLFHQDFGFNNKLHRCDRDHAKSRGLHVNDEEKIKDVPSLNSSIYGHRVDPSELDPPDRKHVRIAHVQTEFFRRRVFNINPPEEEEKKTH